MKISQTDNNTVKISDIFISLKDTFECGQCFRWNEFEKGYIGVAGGRVVYVWQNSPNEMFLTNTNIDDVRDFWVNYFDLKTDYDVIISSIPENDIYLRQAADCGRGIKILRQDPAETIISFIISANNNIKRIKGIIEKLSSLYGDKILYQDTVYFAFPSLSVLNKLTIDDLRILHAGYRDKYLIDAFEKLSDDRVIALKKDPISEDRKKFLLSIKGVGPKVCDCIRLFGFSEYDAFPKDVWIKRVIKEHYGDDFDEKQFGKYAGVYQQYMFHYARNLKG